jgi:glycosyltransferase involved in cell wall biosynthesis
MIAAVIPAYNSEKHIMDIVKKTSAFVDIVIVVDNNSHDKTARLAECVGAMVIHEYIQGAGAATNRGMQIAKAMGADIVVTLDADGQHNPMDIPRVVEPVLRNDADVVFGSRFKNQNVIPYYRRFGIKVITLCCNLYSKEWLTDAQCGLRAFSKFALKAFNIEEHGYGVMIEEVMKAKKLYLRISEVPVQCFYHGLKNDSHMNPVKQGILTLLCILKWRLKLMI